MLKITNPQVVEALKMLVDIKSDEEFLLLTLTNTDDGMKEVRIISKTLSGSSIDEMRKDIDFLFADKEPSESMN